MAKSNKQATLKIVAEMPDDATIEEVMYRLFFQARVDRGKRELEQGKTVSHQTVRRSMAKYGN